MTYNVHTCVGRDGRMDVDRTAAVIRAAGPEVVALQELDAGRRRTGGADQLAWLAEACGLPYRIHGPALLDEADGAYGNGVLSRHPLKLEAVASLEPAPAHRHEPRNAIRVGVRGPGWRLAVVATHLGLRRRQRQTQLGRLLELTELSPRHPEPAALCGDLNMPPVTRNYRRLAGRLTDAAAAATATTGVAPGRTYPARLPLLRLDYVFVNRALRPVAAHVPSGREARRASDHLPLVVDVAPEAA